MNGKAIKIIGAVASVLGAGATLVGNWATKKETDDTIAKKVTEAVAEALKKESN